MMETWGSTSPQVACTCQQQARGKTGQAQFSGMKERRQGKEAGGRETDSKRRQAEKRGQEADRKRGFTGRQKGK
jgi:hypothetical protein